MMQRPIVVTLGRHSSSHSDGYVIRKTTTNCKYITLTYSCVVVAQTPNTV